MIHIMIDVVIDIRIVIEIGVMVQISIMIKVGIVLDAGLAFRVVIAAEAHQLKDGQHDAGDEQDGKGQVIPGKEK